MVYRLLRGFFPPTFCDWITTQNYDATRSFAELMKDFAGLAKDFAQVIYL